MSDSTNPQAGKDEIEPLNAENLDVQELDDALLEEAAGGEDFAREANMACGGFSCTNNIC
jgi:hypothetical protein